MKKAFITFFTLFTAFFATSENLAFPGAEGYGKYTTGGRGGKVYIITNLNDSGPGSLREAIESKGARTIVFEVDGNIELLSPLRINNDSLTIAGQSAPGHGICIKDYPLVVNASNVIIRHIRVRVGDKHKSDADALGGGRYGQKNVILDHISVSWSIDECLSIYKTENLTVQWCLVTHSLRKSVHTKGNHGFGGIWGGNKATFHHNLLANHSSRNPRFSSVEGTKMVDHRNNVIYNWGFKSAYGGGQHGEINLVKNYYKPGPATTNPNTLLDVSDDGTGRYFVDGNYLEGNKEISSSNWKGVGGKNPKGAKVDKPFSFEKIKEDNPKQAYKKVLKKVGCSFNRDKYDIDVINQVKHGKGNFGEKGIIDNPEQVGGWPDLKKGTKRADSDRDGIPDNWEISKKLNPNDRADNAFFTLNKNYTNLEVYLNSLASK